LTEATIKRFRLGWNFQDRYDDPSLWGFDGGKMIYIPKGLIIPWTYKGQVVGLRVRRPDDAVANANGPRYISVRVYPQTNNHRRDHNFLYNADALKPGRPAILVEGEIDTQSVWQEGGDLVAAVATGSVSNGRGPYWQARLAEASVVLVAFDADDAGDNNSLFWTKTLPNAIRWRPLASDPNAMLQEGLDLRAWVQAGLAGVGIT
jgi:DNA primase